MAGNEEEIDMNDDHDEHDSTSDLPARANVQSTKRPLGKTARTTQKKKAKASKVEDELLGKVMGFF